MPATAPGEWIPKPSQSLPSSASSATVTSAPCPPWTTPATSATRASSASTCSKDGTPDDDPEGPLPAETGSGERGGVTPTSSHEGVTLQPDKRGPARALGGLDAVVFRRTRTVSRGCSHDHDRLLTVTITLVGELGDYLVRLTRSRRCSARHSSPSSSSTPRRSGLSC